MKSAKLFCFRDSVSGNVGAVFEAENINVIIRDLKAMASNPQIPRHVIEDLEIYELGHFVPADPVGIIKACKPKIILKGVDFLHDLALQEANDALCTDCDEETD